MGTHFKTSARDIDLTSTAAYEYDLPEELIATEPAQQRESSRLMVVDPLNGAIAHATFSELGDYLRSGDRLVFNNTRVLPGRVFAKKKETGGKVELLILTLHPPHTWHGVADSALTFDAMTRTSKALRPGMRLVVEGDEALEFEVIEYHSGQATVTIAWEGTPLELLEHVGQMPLPPYIVRRRKELGVEAELELDATRYQTVYASAPGAIAAPTAGLHFTQDLLTELSLAGIARSEVTLHVGPGTFKPMSGESLTDHVMHHEPYHISEALGAEIEETQRAAGRVIAVGTTSARALEAEIRRSAPFAPGTRETDLFLYPGHGFELCDGLVTNFHLPSSTLLTLVAARTGYALMRSAYDEAIDAGYKFYSYGDAMLILDGALSQ